MKSAEVVSGQYITDWFNKNSKKLRRYAGKCIVIKAGIGIVAVGRTMKEADKKARTKYPNDVLHYHFEPRETFKYYIF